MKMPQDKTPTAPEKKMPAPQGDCGKGDCDKETNPKQPEASSFSRYFEEPDVLKEHPGVKKNRSPMTHPSASDIKAHHAEHENQGK